LSLRALIVALIMWHVPASGTAQATHIMAPVRETLLRFTQEWGRESALGDLSMRAMGDSDVEVRFWGGYGLFGTTATVLRRTGDVWQAWRAEVQRCPVVLPISVGDTLSAPSLASYRREARKTCGDRRSDSLSAAAVFDADTVGLYPLASAEYEAFWQELKQNGLLELPPEVPRNWMMVDGHTYVVEVRRGSDYRASVIEHTKPESRADTLVQGLARLIQRGPQSTRTH
jgi:hypothetical protein